MAEENNGGSAAVLAGKRETVVAGKSNAAVATAAGTVPAGKNDTAAAVPSKGIDAAATAASVEFDAAAATAAPVESRIVDVATAAKDAATAPVGHAAAPSSATPNVPVAPARCPVVLVHGIAAHDRDVHTSKLWGRVPDALRSHGYPVFFGNTDAWGSVAGNARQVEEAIDTALAETGASQVVLVAHSKGGLDVRSALTLPGVAAKVRGVVTLSSPHKGMRFCTMLAKSRFILPHVASHFFNAFSRLRGDRNPDSIQALRDLTKLGAQGLANRELEPAQQEVLAGVPFFSFGFKSAQGRYPRNHVAAMVRHLDGENDGLVPLGATVHGDHEVVTAQGRVHHDDCTDRFTRDYALVTEAGNAYDSPVGLIVAAVDALEGRGERNAA